MLAMHQVKNKNKKKDEIISSGIHGDGVAMVKGVVKEDISAEVTLSLSPE